jgi:hypothetical protein
MRTAPPEEGGKSVRQFGASLAAWLIAVTLLVATSSQTHALGVAARCGPLKGHAYWFPSEAHAQAEWGEDSISKGPVT